MIAFNRAVSCSSVQGSESRSYAASASTSAPGFAALSFDAGVSAFDRATISSCGVEECARLTRFRGGISLASILRDNETIVSIEPLESEKLRSQRQPHEILLSGGPCTITIWARGTKSSHFNASDTRSLRICRQWTRDGTQ